MLRLLTAALLLLALAGPLGAQTAGTTYPSQKVVFGDPLTGKPVWRMTTTGYNRMGDQTQESHVFSPDGTRIVYVKSAGARPDGLYLNELATGVETLLVPGAPWNANAIFSRDGSEVFYFVRPSTTAVRVMAVKTAAPWTQRIVATLPSQWHEKLAINATGSRLSASIRVTDTTWRLVVLDPLTGAALANWTPTTNVSGDDGAAWHPTDPDLVCASRNGREQEKVWNVVTLQSFASCVSAHAAWHPNGNWYVTQGRIRDYKTGALIIPGEGIYPIHHNLCRTEGPLGLEATVLADDRDWFSNATGRPRLYRVPLRTLATGNYRPAGGLLGVHYGSMKNNTAHAHPQWSPDCRHIAWQSDLADLRDGTPPGGTTNQQAIFVMPMATTTTPPPPPATPPADLQVLPASLAFTLPAGGGPSSQTLQVANVGGGTMPWTVTSQSPWLAVTVGTSAQIAVQATPGALAPGAHQGTVTVTATGLDTLHTPKVIPVALTITAPPTPPPAGLLPAPATLSGSGGLTWPAVPGATGYVVERKLGDGSWVPGPVQTETTQPYPTRPPDCARVRTQGTAGLGPAGPEVCRE